MSDLVAFAGLNEHEIRQVAALLLRKKIKILSLSLTSIFLLTLSMEFDVSVILRSTAGSRFSKIISVEMSHCYECLKIIQNETV